MGKVYFKAVCFGLLFAAAIPIGCIPGPAAPLVSACDGGDQGTDGDGDTGPPDTDEDVDSGGEDDAQECLPATCESLDLAAGLWQDGCGGTLDCGSWIEMDPGVFEMGGTLGEWMSSPAHDVDVPGFRMWTTEVTMEQYAVCSNSGGCDDPISVLEDPGCTWGTGSDQSRPVNCVTWYQARDFCEWAGGRLPSEAEWEYAARGMGQDAIFPWGNEEIDCGHAVMVEAGVGGCGTGTTWSVCSLPGGHTPEGLCDMSGNVHEWIEDDYHLSLQNTGGYDLDGDGVSDAPTDGSAWVDEPRGLYRHMRGGGYSSTAVDLTATARFHHNSPGYWAPRIGFRCAGNLPE